MDDDVILTAAPSPARRFLALGILGGLGALVLWMAAAAPDLSAGGRLVLGVLGLGALGMAGWLRAATRTRLVLTCEALSEEGGEILAPLAAISRSERGPFAAKPSAGFVLRLNRAVGPVAWRPGLWWRLGRRVGVGGVVAGAEARALSEAVAAAVAARGPTT
ncbi:hypothetical protein BCF33_0309 [Hasllibacter halocynthiae]|uniref:Uncharacterized protein n=1 Tax=Hasllibacter halocynthiae TaxID=595589 RepID=A0A2T0X712_9RHOB|nr:hypothetical protein [Hasllibacter halocynthiae]PRY94713.1 hypothetical protein BCF33_0309 [Hasllibacter halocynthiae]